MLGELSIRRFLLFDREIFLTRIWVNDKIRELFHESTFNMKEKAPTIYDVAKISGVSISTVSRVLNSPHQVREKTRNDVLEAINQ